MTYTINGIQYWRRNGICCSWTKEEGRKVISEDMYLEVIGKKPQMPNIESAPVVAEIAKDPKAKVEIAYQEIGKNDRIINKKKVITYGNLDKVIANMEAKDNFVKIIATRDV